MRKLLYLSCLLLALGMTSCIDLGSSGQDYAESSSPDEPNLLDPNSYCWEITMTATKDGQTGTEVEHQWATGAEMIAFFEMVQYKLKDEAPGATLDVKFKKTDRSEEDCRK